MMQLDEDDQYSAQITNFERLSLNPNYTVLYGRVYNPRRPLKSKSMCFSPVVECVSSDDFSSSAEDADDESDDEPPNTDHSKLMSVDTAAPATPASADMHGFGCPTTNTTLCELDCNKSLPVSALKKMQKKPEIFRNQTPGKKVTQQYCVVLNAQLHRSHPNIDHQLTRDWTPMQPMA